MKPSQMSWVTPEKEPRDCPCCGQLVKLYERQIYAEMAHDLIKLYWLTRRRPDEGFFYYKEFRERGGDFGKLQHWGFIVSLPNDTDPTKKVSGFWSITETGKAYVEGRLNVHKYALVFNDTFFGFEGPLLSIHDALRAKFDYSKLMGAE